MFFHLASGLGRALHEIAGIAMIIGVCGHAYANGFAIKRYLSLKLGVGIIGFFVLLTLLSLLPIGSHEGEHTRRGEGRAAQEENRALTIDKH